VRLSGLAFGLALAVRPQGRRRGRSGQCAAFRPGRCDIFTATGALGATVTVWPWCWRCGSGTSRWAWRPQQLWLGTARAGQKVTLWIDASTVHLSVGGWRIETVPSRLSAVDQARLRRADARPAGPPPAGPSPGALASSRCVEVNRLVNGIGGITLLNRLILIGSPLAGQRARIRLDGQLMHVITQDGVLWRTLPCPIPPHQRHRLQGVRLAGPHPCPRPLPPCSGGSPPAAASRSPARRSRSA
jgi:hypothetical protein